ncbi:MAG: FecR domain-containing protein [Cyclobacteriaceae bacterium]
MEEILAKYFSGEASKREQEEVLKWRSASEENSRAFLEYKQVWLDSIQPESANTSLLNSILEDESTHQIDDVKVIPIWQTGLFKFAASLLILLGIVFTIYQSNSGSSELPDFVAIESRTLEDGTEVVLHDDAQLEVVEFGDVRKVRLDGKAYFNVKRDESRPFLIETSSATVRVLGTSFVVNADSEVSQAEVMVESGLVAFAARDMANEVELSKGERARLKVGASEIEKTELKDMNYLAWKTHKIEFKKSSLQEVFSVLEDVYEISVDFDEKRLGSCQLTATFNEKNILEVSKIIEATFNIKSSIDSGVLSFSGQGCQ